MRATTATAHFGAIFRIFGLLARPARILPNGPEILRLLVIFEHVSLIVRVHARVYVTEDGCQRAHGALHEEF